MSDQELFNLCQKYGRQSLLWRQKFLGLLPEVYRRRLYERKGFESIFVFAKKLAGVSEEQVRLVLNLEKRFEDKPVLHQMLVGGQVSVNKLARVASIATAENERDLAEQVAVLPNRAVETLVRDCKIQNGLQEPKNNAKSLHVQTLQLSEEVQKKMLELQEKGIDVNSLLMEFLQEREMKIVQKKERIAAEAQQTESRYVPVEIQEVLAEEYGKKCSIPGCPQPSEEIHHAQRFSLAKIHDPRYMAPMCYAHHIIAHSIDRKFHVQRSQSP